MNTASKYDERCEDCGSSSCEAETTWCPSCGLDYHADRLRCPRCGVTPGKYTHVNVYAVTRHYGGPEEGGWWYNAGEPVASIALTEDDDADQVAAAVERKYIDLSEGDIYLVLGGVQIEVHKQYHFAKPWPETRPHYE